MYLPIYLFVYIYIYTHTSPILVISPCLEAHLGLARLVHEVHEVRQVRQDEACVWSPDQTKNWEKQLIWDWSSKIICDSSGIYW